MNKDGDNSSMTSLTAMTGQELLELAALDAFGLLDSFETERYTRSFHHAPAAVQDEIIRVQAELAGDARLLSPEEPDSSLRQRVLAAVAEAMERENSQFAPLATIGRRGRGAEGRMALAGAGQFWRAAAFALAAMVAVVVYIWFQTDQSRQLTFDLASDRLTLAELKAMVGNKDFELFLKNPNKVVKALRPVATDSAEFQGTATAFINAKSDEALVFCIGIPELGEPGVSATPYTLTMRFTDGTSKSLSFDSNGGVSAVRIEGISGAKLVAAHWEISGPHGVVLSSA